MAGQHSLPTIASTAPIILEMQGEAKQNSILIQTVVKGGRGADFFLRSLMCILSTTRASCNALRTLSVPKVDILINALLSSGQSTRILMHESTHTHSQIQDAVYNVLQPCSYNVRSILCRNFSTNYNHTNKFITRWGEGF